VPAVLAVKQFGKYQIVRKLGRSMSDVYLAQDEAANRQVVLKIVEHASDASTDALIAAERRGAVIQHELHGLDARILEVYEYGDQDNCFFVAMEYCEGLSLAQIIARESRLIPSRAVRYAAEVASQLNTLHSFQAEIDGRKRAIVHGDIKPANIQVDPSDSARLLDFGIAKTITATHNLTSHNLGSPAYCSPERLSNAQVDPSADLWALGVTLYELVAGIPPYQAQTTRRLENLIQSRRPPRALPSDCPAPLKAIVAKALAADPAHRYATAEAFEEDLRAFLQKRPTAAETEPLPTWDSNATLAKKRPTSERRSPWMPKLSQWAREANRTIWALAAGLIAGLIVLIPPAYLYRFWVEAEPLRAAQDYSQKSVADIASDWQLYKGLQQQNRFLAAASPISWVEPALRSRLLTTAQGIIDEYRSSPDPVLDHFDWEKAQICLRHALEISPSDKKSQARAALCDGYLLMMRNPGPAVLTTGTEADFDRAASLDRHWPDPHLALARLNAYGYHNAGQTAAELNAADHLGFQSGPREIEMQADAFFYRAQQEFRMALKDTGMAETKRRRMLLQARRNFNRARELYEPISGFSNVGDNLEKLDSDEAAEQQWEEKRAAAAHVHTRSRYVRNKTWR